MTRDLEIAGGELLVLADDLGDRVEDVLALVLQRILTRCEEHVARQRDDHPVVPDRDLQTEVRELLELRAELFEALPDRLELSGALLELLERALGLVEARREPLLL